MYLNVHAFETVESSVHVSECWDGIRVHEKRSTFRTKPQRSMFSVGDIAGCRGTSS